MCTDCWLYIHQKRRNQHIECTLIWRTGIFMEDHWWSVGRAKKKTSRNREHFFENQFGAVLTSIQTMRCSKMYFEYSTPKKKVFRWTINPHLAQSLLHWLPRETTVQSGTMLVAECVGSHDITFTCSHIPSILLIHMRFCIYFIYAQTIL